MDARNRKGSKMTSFEYIVNEMEKAGSEEWNDFVRDSVRNWGMYPTMLSGTCYNDEWSEYWLRVARGESPDYQTVSMDISIGVVAP